MRDIAGAVAYLRGARAPRRDRRDARPATAVAEREARARGTRSLSNARVPKVAPRAGPCVARPQRAATLPSLQQLSVSELRVTTLVVRTVVFAMRQPGYSDRPNQRGWVCLPWRVIACTRKAGASGQGHPEQMFAIGQNAPFRELP